MTSDDIKALALLFAASAIGGFIGAALAMVIFK